MASSRSSVIQLDDGHDAQSELQFQDFTLGGGVSSVATLSPSGSYSNYKEDLDSPGDETEDLLGTEQKEGSSSSFWQFSYYQSFFDVDTDQVVQRVMWSMIPLPGQATFLDRQIKPKPDLYGPFWIAATLVFSTAICANIANFLKNEGMSDQTWSYDFHKVSLAATAIYSYTFLLPIILWGLMWYRQSSNRYSLLEILCVYGYSLAIYVPISVLWVIQVAWFQWILLIIGAALSGTVLIQTFWPIFRDENKKIAAVVLCLILVFHTLLAVGFVTYFFQPPKNAKFASTTTTADLSFSSVTTEHVTTNSTLDTKLKSLAQVKEDYETAKIQHSKKVKNSGEVVNQFEGKKVNDLLKNRVAEIKNNVPTNESNEYGVSTEQHSLATHAIATVKI